jgi:hypothetical protein
MATKFDVSALTLNPLEATEVSQAVIEQVFVMSELAENHDIQLGIQMKEQIVFVGQLGIGGEALTNCTPAEQDALAFTQKYWDPALIAGRFTNCQNDLNKLFKLFKKAQKANPDYFDKEGSEEMAMLSVAITESIKTSVNAKVWYSDLVAALFSGGGNFTNTTNLGLFNQFDGLFKQIFADGAIPRYTISENSGATYAAQTLAAGKSYTILKSLYNLADPRLLGDAEAKIYVTRSIYDNYLDYLETTEAVGGNIQVTEDGRKLLSYRGIPVKLQNEWDRIQNLYQNDGTVVFRPHRALMTVPGNIPVGTLSEDDLQSLESWYEKKDKSNYVDFAYFLDAKHLESYYSTVAY